MVSQRAGSKVDKRRTFPDLLVFRLDNTADNADNSAFPFGSPFFSDEVEASEVRKDFFRRFFTNVAGVEDNEIGIPDGRGFRIAERLQDVGYPSRIIDIHLAAKSFNIILHSLPYNYSCLIQIILGHNIYLFKCYLCDFGH